MASPEERPARRRNPRGQGGRLRDEILAGAAALMERTGTEESVTLRSVAREIGITAPSITPHFSTPADIIDAAVAIEVGRLVDALEAGAASSDDPVEALRGGWGAYLAYGQAHPGRYQVVMQRSFLPAWDEPGRTMTETTPRFARAVALMVGLLQRCVEVGRSTSADPLVDSVAIWCALHGLVALPATITLSAMPSSETAFAWPPADRLLDEVLTNLGHLRPA